MHFIFTARGWIGPGKWIKELITTTDKVYFAIANRQNRLMEQWLMKTDFKLGGNHDIVTIRLIVFILLGNWYTNSLNEYDRNCTIITQAMNHATNGIAWNIRNGNNTVWIGSNCKWCWGYFSWCQLNGSKNVKQNKQLWYDISLV